MVICVTSASTPPSQQQNYYRNAIEFTISRIQYIVDIPLDHHDTLLLPSNNRIDVNVLWQRIWSSNSKSCCHHKRTYADHYYDDYWIPSTRAPFNTYTTEFRLITYFKIIIIVLFLLCWKQFTAVISIRTEHLVILDYQATSNGSNQLSHQHHSTDDNAAPLHRQKLVENISSRSSSSNTTLHTHSSPFVNFSKLAVVNNNETTYTTITTIATTAATTAVVIIEHQSAIGNPLLITSSTVSTSHDIPVPQIPAYIRNTAVFFCIVILLLGVVGNIMVPIVIIKTKDMRNSTNIFLTNLSIADLLVLLVCTPTVLVEVNTPPETWILGHEMCKAVPFVELTVAHASVLTILAISFERYYAICEPLKAGYVCTKARAILICILAWGIAALFTSPILWVAEYKYVEYVDGSLVAVCLTQAITDWTVLFFMMTITMFFMLPLVILIILYGIIAKNLISNNGPMMRIRPTKPEFSLKARKQVVYMLGAVVLSFFLCLLPFRMLTIWIILSSEHTIVEIGFERYYILLYFSRIMFYLNSAMNPILYNLMSTKFRKGFFKLSCGVWQCLWLALTLRHHNRSHAKGDRNVASGAGGVGGGTATTANTNTISNTVTTTTSSSLLSHSSNRRQSSDDIAKVRIQIQMQIPCGSDHEMIAMLHSSISNAESKDVEKHEGHRRPYAAKRDNSVVLQLKQQYILNGQQHKSTVKIPQLSPPTMPNESIDEELDEEANIIHTINTIE